MNTDVPSGPAGPDERRTMMPYPLSLGSAAALADPKGGELISYTGPDGVSYLWDGDPRYWTGRSPNLFPIIGDLPGGYLADGGRYFMHKHGFARDSLFQLEERQPSELTFRLRESPSTLSVYPYRFTLLLTHRLEPEGFSTRYTVINTGEKPLPFCLGGHVGFRCPLTAEEQFSDYLLRFDGPVTVRALRSETAQPLDRGDAFPLLSGTDTLHLSHSLFDRGALILEGLPRRRVSLISEKSGHGVRLEFEDFPVLALWTIAGKNAPYLCLEPWHGLPALTTDPPRLEGKPYAVTLAPMRQAGFQYRVTVLSPA